MAITNVATPNAPAAPLSLVPPNTTCYLDITYHRANCLFSVLSRAGNLRGSKQTHRSRILNVLHEQIKEFEEARMALLKLYGKKNETGELVKRRDDNMGMNLGASVDVYELEDRAAFESSFAQLVREQTIIVDGNSNQLINRALGVVYDLLQTDECPPLAPPRPGQPPGESEVLLFGQVIDAFQFTPAKS